MNHVLVRQTEGEMFVTLFYGVLDLISGELEFCVAGQTPPWLILESGSEPLKHVRGTMLGLFDDPEIGMFKMRLAPGSSFFVATDGVIDAERADGSVFGEAGVRVSLNQSAARSADEIVQTLFKEVSAFSAGAPQSDDITALSIRYLGP